MAVPDGVGGVAPGSGLAGPGATVRLGHRLIRAAVRSRHGRAERVSLADAIRVPAHGRGGQGAFLAFCVRPGTRGKWLPRDEHGRYIDRWVRGDPASDHVWAENRILWLAKRGEAHSLGLLWRDDTHEFLGWYVQLQAPLQGTRLGLITEWPFPTGWEDWRPDPAWPVP